MTSTSRFRMLPLASGRGRSTWAARLREALDPLQNAVLEDLEVLGTAVHTRRPPVAVNSSVGRSAQARERSRRPGDDAVVEIRQANADLAHFPSCLVGRRLGQRIPVLHLVGQSRMRRIELILGRGQKGPSTRLRGDTSQHLLPSQGNSGNPANRDCVDGRTRRLERGQRFVDSGGAVLVVAIGHQDHRAPASALLSRSANCCSESRIAVPPAVRTLPIACSIVARSLVGPVTEAGRLENGATRLAAS